MFLIGEKGLVFAQGPALENGEEGGKLDFANRGRRKKGGWTKYSCADEAKNRGGVTFAIAVSKANKMGNKTETGNKKESKKIYIPKSGKNELCSS